MVILAVSQTCHCLISTYYFGTVGSHRKGRYIPLAALVRRVGASQMSSMQSDLLKQVHAFHALAGVTLPQHMFMQKLIRSASLLLCLSCKTACVEFCFAENMYQPLSVSSLLLLLLLLLLLPLLLLPFALLCIELCTRDLMWKQSEHMLLTPACLSI